MTTRFMFSAMAMTAMAMARSCGLLPLGPAQKRGELRGGELHEARIGAALGCRVGVCELGACLVQLGARGLLEVPFQAGELDAQGVMA